MPDPCFYSSLVRYFWPAGLPRRNSTAASEKAHLRWALPIFVPEVPYRFPADSFVHDKAAIREEILDPREAGDIKFVEQHQAQDLANPRGPYAAGTASGHYAAWPFYGWKPRLGAAGRSGQSARGRLRCSSAPRIGKPLGDPVAVRFVGDLFPNLGQVILTIGLLDMREQLCAFAHQMRPPPEQVAGCPHGSRRDVGLREHAATRQHSDFLGVDLIVSPCRRGWLSYRERGQGQKECLRERRGRRASTR